MADVVEELRFPLLGDRTYLHGTTLYDALVSRVPEDAAVSFKFSKRIMSDGVRIGPAGDIVDPFASLKWDTGAGSGTILAEPLECSPAPARTEFDEDRIVAEASVTEALASYDGPSPYSFVATVVPLFKALLHHAAPVSEAGQWFFTRLDAPERPTWPAPVTITLGNLIPGRLAHGKISAGGRDSAGLYFSWVS